MEFKDLVEARRSLRKFDATRKIEKSFIKDLLKIALEAPSWKNSETARYHCVMSSDLIKKFRNECLPSFNRDNTDGVTALLVTGFLKNISGFDDEKNPVNNLGNGWGCYDLGLQNMNLILAAKEKGLDTLIMGIRNEDKIRSLLNLPENETVVSVIAIGYGAVTPAKPKRKSVEDVLSIY